MTPPQRRAETRSGPLGERVAAATLARLGYQIAAHNLRTRYGEIDILCRDGSEWVAVEVKARADHPAPEHTVGQEQLDRIERSLRAIARSLRPRPMALRIDVVAVRWTEPDPEVRHFPSVRCWAYCQPRCGSASVPTPPLADTGSRDFFLHLLFSVRRILCAGFDALTRTRASSRPRDADPR